MLRVLRRLSYERELRILNHASVATEAALQAKHTHILDALRGCWVAHRDLGSRPCARYGVHRHLFNKRRTWSCECLKCVLFTRCTHRMHRGCIYSPCDWMQMRALDTTYIYPMDRMRPITSAWMHLLGGGAPTRRMHPNH